MNKFCFTIIFLVAVTHLRAQNDSLLPDTFAIPKVTLNASPSFIYILSPEFPVGAGCELKVLQHFSVNISGGYVFPGLIGSRYLDPEGYGFGVEPRYYFLRKNAMYLGIIFSASEYKESATVGFTDANHYYYKRTRITKESYSICPMIGWYGSVNTHIKFPIGIAFGLRLEFRNFYYSNLTQHEINLIQNGKSDGLYSANSGRPVSLMLGISTPIGWVVKR